MFPGPQPPFSRGMPPRFTRQGMGHRTLFPGQRPNMGSRFGPNTGMRGGLLSRLFGRGGASGGMGIRSSPLGSMQAARGGGGLLQAFSNPSAINGFLTNTQKVLNTASQVGPMIQQYGPLVRNLPAMWKIYKGFKKAGNTEDNSKNSLESSSIEESDDKNGKSEVKRQVQKSTNKKTKTPSKQSLLANPSKSIDDKGKSVPKLYI